MGALKGEGGWKAEGDPRRWRGPLGGANLSLEGGGGPGGRRGPWREEGGGGPRGRREPLREKGLLEGRGDPWRVEVLVQSVDAGPQRDERDSRR